MLTAPQSTVQTGLITKRVYVLRALTDTLVRRKQWNRAVHQIILIESAIPTKQARLVKVCLNGN